MCKIQDKANSFLIIEQLEPIVPSKGWAEMIRKAYETDPLFSPKCGSQMRIIALIEYHQEISVALNNPFR